VRDPGEDGEMLCKKQTNNQTTKQPKQRKQAFKLSPAGCIFLSAVSERRSKKQLSFFDFFIIFFYTALFTQGHRGTISGSEGAPQQPVWGSVTEISAQVPPGSQSRRTIVALKATQEQPPVVEKGKQLGLTPALLPTHLVTGGASPASHPLFVLSRDNTGRRRPLVAERCSLVER
jgi:hypothetical protein